MKQGTIDAPGRRAAFTLWHLDRALHKLIQNGTLRIHLPEGELRAYGSGMPVIAISIHDRSTLRRIAFNPYSAVGEAWMDGAPGVETKELYAALALCLHYAETLKAWHERFLARSDESATLYDEHFAG